VLTIKEKNKQLVFERQVLGTICGLKVETVCTGWDTIPNSRQDSTARESAALQRHTDCAMLGHMIRKPEDLIKAHNCADDIDDENDFIATFPKFAIS
jgi:hypothetical protein